MARSVFMAMAIPLCAMRLTPAMADPPRSDNVEFLNESNFVRLSNPGVKSLQLIAPTNSKSTRITITQVTIAPGASQPRHTHPTSEQIWVVQSGSATLLLANNEAKVVKAGEVVRFEDGAVHGAVNSTDEPFVYLSVTSPPIDFSNAYHEKK